MIGGGKCRFILFGIFTVIFVVDTDRIKLLEINGKGGPSSNLAGAGIAINLQQAESTSFSGTQVSPDRRLGNAKSSCKRGQANPGKGLPMPSCAWESQRAASITEETRLGRMSIRPRGQEGRLPCLLPPPTFLCKSRHAASQSPCKNPAPKRQATPRRRGRPMGRQRAERAEPSAANPLPELERKSARS